MAGIGAKILLPNGDPNGVGIIELTGWKGRAFAVPRGRLKELDNLEEANHPGVYFLFGDDKETSHPRVYIGESESFLNRLNNHDANKEFWNTAVVFSGGLNKAHVGYLENRCLQAAKQINRYEVENRKETTQKVLDRFEKNEADDFFAKIELILGLLKYSVFQEVPKVADAKEIYFCKPKTKDSANAQGTLLPTGEFVVFAGSLAQIEPAPSFSGSGPVLRNRLISEGVLKKKNSVSYIFTKDYVFSSPSAASDTVLARSSNGWTNWFDANDKSLDENKRQ